MIPERKTFAISLWMRKAQSGRDDGGLRKMEMNVKKIVVTGGPCAGKSTSLEGLKKTVESTGYKVILVPESATELVGEGITPESCGSIYEFEKQVAVRQLENEEKAGVKAKALRSEKVLIVCDRGTMDCKAFLEERDFEKLCAALGKGKVQLRDEYDGIFFLASAARGDGKNYTISNNPARRESREEAAALDGRTLSAWLGHPHLRVIQNTEDFVDKVKGLTADIMQLLGEPEPLEIERKFLIKYPDTAELSDKGKYAGEEIEQVYLEDADGHFRIRRRGEDGEYIYFLTRKKQVSPVTRIEIEEHITEDEYKNYVCGAGNSGRKVSKTRYCFVYEGHYFELDVFPFWKDRALLEIELRYEDEEVKMPPQFEIIREVTEEEEYKNSKIAAMVSAGLLKVD